MKYLKQLSVNTIVLAFFFRSAQAEDQTWPEADVVEAFAGKIGALRVRMALETLRKSDYIKDINPDFDYIYQLTATGYAKAEEYYLAYEKGLVRTIVDSGLDAYFDRLTNESDSSKESEISSIPASDRFVTISDNMAGYNELVATTEAASEQIRGSNELAAEEKSWIKIHLDAGIELLKRGGRVLASALKSLLVEPLEEALKESSQEGMKAAIKAAIIAIKTYLGLL